MLHLTDSGKILSEFSPEENTKVPYEKYTFLGKDLAIYNKIGNVELPEPQIFYLNN